MTKRSSWKSFFFKKNVNLKNPIWKRSIVVHDNFFKNLTKADDKLFLKISMGKNFHNKLIEKGFSVFHKLGEFSFTRKEFFLKKKKIKKKK